MTRVTGDLLRCHCLLRGQTCSADDFNAEGHCCSMQVEQLAARGQGCVLARGGAHLFPVKAMINLLKASCGCA